MTWHALVWIAKRDLIPGFLGTTCGDRCFEMGTEGLYRQIVTTTWRPEEIRLGWENQGYPQ